MFLRRAKNQNRIKLAEKMAKDSKPMTFNLVFKDTPECLPPLHIIGIGDYKDSEEIAKYLSHTIQNLKASNPKAACMVLALGDNRYPSGTQKADEVIQQHLEELAKESNIPIFGILGNHDEGRSKTGIFLKEKGIGRGKHQVAHAYLDHPHVYDNTILCWEDLSFWNMPHEYYSIIYDNTQIFCINGNSYVKDCLDAYSNNSNTDENNQAIWMERAYLKAREAGKQIILAIHNPIKSVGKRNYHSDAPYFLTSNEIKEAKDFFKIDAILHPTHQDLLKASFKNRKIKFDLILSAHDHAMYYINDLSDPEFPIREITAGGGGGKLQDRQYFANQSQLGCFLKHPGFVEIVCHEDPVENYSIFNALGKDRNYQIVFNINSLDPIRFYDQLTENEIKKIDDFSKLIKRALEAYFSFLNVKQETRNGDFFTKKPQKGNISHGYYGLDRAHDIWAYLSDHKAEPYLQTIRTVFEMAKWHHSFKTKHITHPTEHSLISFIEKEIEKVYGEDKNKEAYNLKKLCSEEPNQSNNQEDDLHDNLYYRRFVS